MSKTTYTTADLAALAEPYFDSNPDTDLLLATSHDGLFYRPEARSYAEHEARQHQSEVVEITHLDCMEALYGASSEPDEELQTLSEKPAEEVALTAGLAELVNGATSFFFPTPIPEAELAPFAANLQPIVAAPAAAPKKKASTKKAAPAQ